MKLDINLINGDSLVELAGIPENSIDSIVTDPPYGLKFMGKKWDCNVPAVELWAECLRVLKPGGHLLAFAGTRTQHRMAVNIEDSGLEIRDVICWHYGSGFPKSQNIGKAIDRQAGAKREAVGPNKFAHLNGKKNKACYGVASRPDSTLPATDAAKQWDGWGTALKPATEFITVARKPLSEKTIAANVLKWGTGGINIDGSRVETGDKLSFGSRELGDGVKYGKCKPATEGRQNSQGRWPANLIHDGSDEVVERFPQTSPSNPHTRRNAAGENNCMSGANYERESTGYTDKGSAARFFYCAKASKSERNAGCENLEERVSSTYGDFEGSDVHAPKSNIKRQNNHPTVKPLKLMSHLVNLVTPPGGTVLDPFMGSGTTGIACKNNNFGFIGIELDSDYYEIAENRISE